jgi:hypothetical protein
VDTTFARYGEHLRKRIEDAVGVAILAADPESAQRLHAAVVTLQGDDDMILAGRSGVADVLAPALGVGVCELEESLRVLGAPGARQARLFVLATRRCVHSDEARVIEAAAGAGLLDPLTSALIVLCPVRYLASRGHSVSRQVRDLFGRRCSHIMTIVEPPNETLPALAWLAQNLRVFANIQATSRAIRMAEAVIVGRLEPWATRLASDLERILLEPTAEVISEIEALRDTVSGYAELPEQLRDEVLAQYLSPPGLVPISKDPAGHARRWRVLANSLAPRECRVALGMAASYERQSRARHE